MPKNLLLNALNDRLLAEEIVNKNEIYVYHCAHIESLDSIGKTGFERYFSAKGVGNAYGSGIYSTFDLKSSIKNALEDKGYGRVILKCKVKSLRNFLIYIPEIASKVYGNPSIDFQLQKILGDKEYQKLKNSTGFPNSYHHWCVGNNIYNLITNKVNVPYTSYCCHAVDWYAWKNPVVDASVEGFIFKGPVDGIVCILRDFKVAYPVEVCYSVQNGEFLRNGGDRWQAINHPDTIDTNLVSFEPFKTSEDFEDFAKNDVDLLRQIRKLGWWDKFDTYTCPYCSGTGRPRWGNGLYCAGCYGEGYRPKVPEYFTNNFARVKKDGKYNYLYRKNYTHGVISPIGFDEAPMTFDRNNQALVKIGEKTFIIKLTEPPIKFTVYSTDGEYVCDLKQLDLAINNDSDGSDEEIDWG
jgi:hypothetical protein